MRSDLLRSSLLTAGPSTVCSLMSPGSRRGRATAIGNHPEPTLRRRGPPKRPSNRLRAVLRERLDEGLHRLCRERLGLDDLEEPDLREDAERGLRVRVLHDREEVPRAHEGEDVLDLATLRDDDLADLLEVERGLLQVLPPFRRELDESDVREHAASLCCSYFPGIGLTPSGGRAIGECPEKNASAGDLRYVPTVTASGSCELAVLRGFGQDFGVARDRRAAVATRPA